MNHAGLKNHFANWREWEMNPIVVKELRQAVRSWAVTSMLLLFLVTLFIISLGFLVFQSFNVDPYAQLGGEMFTWFTVILAVSSVIFIPLYMGIRVAVERRENDPDLLYVSTLSPWRIILGKFLCGAYMAILFFSACMPFMAFTNLLRGVDLPTIFYILFYLFQIVCAANMFAIFLACIPVSRPFKGLFMLVGIIAAFWMLFPVIGFSLSLLHTGIAMTVSGGAFWSASLSGTGVGLLVIVLFYTLAVALVSPPSTNRALPVRLYITAMWLLTGLLNLGWVIKWGRSDVIYSWLIPMFILLLVSLVNVIGNSDDFSHRVRRAIPSALWKRVLAFPFFNGAAGGLVWVAALMAATFLVSMAIISYIPDYRGDDHEWMSMDAITAYVFDYALTALFIQRTFFPKRPAKLTGLLGALIAATCALAPSILLFFMNKLTWQSIEGVELGNVFNIVSMRDDSRLIEHFYFAFGWLALLIVLNARWFFRQVRKFAPPPKEVPPGIPYGPNPTSPAAR